ncbi:HPP family protein [Massilia sp. PAMC28688]|uniref:HPP family protein n=1 Tax=Massilia sp. PAMC28688 TaxID=2861283 RepID=UPI001C62A6E7|nr:HPP family protein [Massilia sp. PAMC28688]QYF93926.1 HPP family protein [Massilia sp. PAMC28688]
MNKPDWRHLLPPANTASRAEQARGMLGALLGLGLTAILCSLWAGHGGVWLVAPMGASAVLLFCLPASPLAQPWSVIGGNMVSAATGVACLQVLGEGVLTAPVAGALAIGMMFALRCLHPPGGAVALTAVLAGPEVQAMGYQFVLLPVAFNCLLMVVAAFAYNNLSGRRYPHAQRSPLENAHATGDAAPTARLGFAREDLDEVLAEYGQVLDVSRDDLEHIILATETHAHQRRFGIITCGAIMSRDVVTVEFGTDLGEAWRTMRYHQVHAMPVLNRARRVIGMLAQGDFLRHSDLDDYRTLGARLRNLIRRSGLSHSEKPEVVGQIMTHEVQRAWVDTPIVELVPLMANSGLHHIPVLDRDQRLAGMVTQSDIIAALYQSRLAQATQPARPLPPAAVSVPRH